MNPPGVRYRVWDLPVRLFHWALVLLVVAQWLSGQYRLLPMSWHYVLGYATLALLLFRILWGVFGSPNARFAAFVRSPSTVLSYLRTAPAHKTSPQLGHNPLGGWSVLAMLTALSVQAVSGLFASNTVDEFGPLSSRVSAATARLMTDIHDLGKNVLMLLIVAHIIGVAYHHRTMHDDLIGPMISGHKTLPSDPGLQFASSSRALALAALSAAIVWGVVAWL